MIDVEKSKKFLEEFLGLDVVSTTVGGVGTLTNSVIATG
jgi:catechol 2,3-dioxygenase-like lactoylglutathione lyase family enzyme